VRLWDEAFRETQKELSGASERIHRIRTISSLIGRSIGDIQTETKRRIADLGIKTLADVRERGKNLVSFSEDMERKAAEAKAFLFEKVYRHEKVVEMSDRAKRVVTDLFNAYCEDPKLLPEKFYKRFSEGNSKRHVCDYIAGMTDRFALETHKKLFDS